MVWRLRVTCNQTLFPLPPASSFPSHAGPSQTLPNTPAPCTQVVVLGQNLKTTMASDWIYIVSLVRMVRLLRLASISRVRRPRADRQHTGQSSTRRRLRAATCMLPTRPPASPSPRMLS